MKGRKNMKKLVALVLALAMAFSLAACGSSGGTSQAAQSGSTTDSSSAAASSGDSTSTEATELSVSAAVDSEPTYGGSATVLYGDELLQYFDPAMGDNRTYSLWLECLFNYDWGANEPEHGSSSYTNYTYYAGQIADSYEVDYDAGTITVTIRDDVYFQDKSSVGLGDYDVFKGRKLLASDVAYSYDRLLGIDGVTATQNTEMPWNTLLPAIESIEATDDTTVVFHIPGLTEVQLDSFITAPVNITGPEWDTLTTDQQNDWHYATGTGPYILTDFQLNASMSYVKNENYYDYDERHPENKLPYLDEIKYVQISDSSNILTQFISGQLDIISFGNDLLSTSEMENLRDTLGMGNYTEYNYYTAPYGLSGHYNLTDSPMSNQTVREAMQHAIDIATISKAVYGVDEPTLWGLWAEPVGWDSGALAEAQANGEYDYDPELAKEMLTEAGYGDGFTFTYYVKNDADLSMIAQMVKQYLNQVGITMNIEVVSDTSELNAHATNQDEDCVTSTNPGQFSLKFASMSVFAGGPAYSWFIPDSKWDELGAQITSATSLESQKEAAQELDQMFVEGHYSIYTTGCGKLHQFYSGKLGGVSGEQFCCNLNTRIMIARLWSSTGE
jgi:ABC-type transport system substrate-binding protein